MTTRRKTIPLLVRPYSHSIVPGGREPLSAIAETMKAADMRQPCENGGHSVRAHPLELDNGHGEP
jgi:hypothetical protein